MECSCSIDSCCGEDTYNEHEEEILIHDTTSVSIKCGECSREIEIGEKFEWYRGEYDEERHTHHTCMDCLSLRFYFFNNWIFENLWADFESNMDECDWEVPESCLSKVTPLTRSKICGWIEDYWKDKQ